MCNYCRNPTWILAANLSDMGKDDYVRVFIKNGHLFLIGNNWQTSIKISACPICGDSIVKGQVKPPLTSL